VYWGVLVMVTLIHVIRLIVYDDTIHEITVFGVIVYPCHSTLSI